MPTDLLTRDTPARRPRRLGARHEPAVSARRPDLRTVPERRRAARLHLFTYVVGNAVFWALWAAAFVTADPWYWWPVLPFAGWTIVLAIHLWRAYRR